MRVCVSVCQSVCHASDAARPKSFCLEHPLSPVRPPPTPRLYIAPEAHHRPPSAQLIPPVCHQHSAYPASLAQNNPRCLPSPSKEPARHSSLEPKLRAPNTPPPCPHTTAMNRPGPLAASLPGRAPPRPRAPVGRDHCCRIKKTHANSSTGTSSTVQRDEPAAFASQIEGTSPCCRRLPYRSTDEAGSSPSPQ